MFYIIFDCTFFVSNIIFFYSCGKSDCCLGDNGIRINFPVVLLYNWLYPELIASFKNVIRLSSNINSSSAFSISFAFLIKFLLYPFIVDWFTGLPIGLKSTGVYGVCKSATSYW